MVFDESCLHFLTAKGKSLYRCLKQNAQAAFTAMRGEYTLSRMAASVQGRAEEVVQSRLPGLFAKDPYMAEIYPNKSSRSALTVFRICEGTGEWFDLSKHSIECAPLSFGGAEK